MKIIVAHPGQQHSFRLATALKKHGLLEKYLTTVYLKKGNATHFLTRFLNNKFRERAKGRHCEALLDSDVIQFCELEGLLRLFAQNVPFFNRYHNKIQNHLADRFAKKVAKYAIKNQVDIVVAYGDTSPLLFETLKKKAPHIRCVLDVPAANRVYMKEIYQKDIELAPLFSSRLLREREDCWDPALLARGEREIKAADTFLSPSEFVDTSLMFSGARKADIMRCCYGVNVAEFSAKETYYVNERRPLEFVYVGGVKELKGIYYLLEAFSQIPKEKAALTVIGNVDFNDADLAPYKEVATFTGLIPHSDVPRYLKKADVFVFPSLGDGFSFAVIEAAASGLPLLVSENTGAKDCMTGDEGFIIPIQSVDAIVEKVCWFVEHPDSIEKMGRAARKMAEVYSWDRYNQRMGEIFKMFEEGT